MCKTVIRITIAGILCVAAGSVLAQGNSAGRAPAAGAVASGNIAVPAVSALNRPIAVPVARTPDLVATPQGLAVAAANFAATVPGRAGAGLSGTAPGLSGIAPGLSGTAPGLSGTAPGLSVVKPGQAGISSDREKSTKDFDSSRVSGAASQSAGLQHKQLHQIPTCN